MNLHHNDDDPCPMCESKLEGAHVDLVTWFREVKSLWSNCHVSWAFRNEALQNKAYENHASNLKWPMSAHNHMENNKPCALALDIFQIDEDGVGRFSPKFYSMVWD